MGIQDYHWYLSNMPVGSWLFLRTFSCERIRWGADFVDTYDERVISISYPGEKARFPFSDVGARRLFCKRPVTLETSIFAPISYTYVGPAS
jgi:hypothetical protein